MHNKRRLFAPLLLLLAGAALLAQADAPAPERPIYQLTLEGVIGPASDDYLERGLDKAIGANAELVVIRMDTPGGLDTSMRNMIRNITASPVPVVSFVSPTGARAASAGTYILYASHVAAMSPGTNLGAATPVQIGGTPGTPGRDPAGTGDKEGRKPAAPADAGKQKAINDAVAYIRSLAQLRGRNQEWAEKAVRQAASLPASDALEQNVIDLLATDMVDLLKQLDGRQVKIQDRTLTLHTTGKTLHAIEPDWRNRLLAIITNPNIAYILMLIGIYGLIFEFSNPGAIVPGTLGAICLLLALYSFQLLPINYAGMALILLGIGLMVAEAFQPSFGVLGIGGVVAFVFGSIILMDTEAPGFGIDLAIIGVFTLSSAMMFILVVGLAMKARHRPVVSGMEQLVGGIAVALEDFDGQGSVRIQSETWNAVSDQPVQRQQRLEVIGIDGLVLRVRPVSSTHEEDAS